MAKKDKKVSKIKIKKKIWYKIFSPKLFGQKELGEIYLTAPDTALNRTLKINLKELTGNVKDQKAYIDFQINEVDGSTLRTKVIGYQLTSTYVKKLVRKNTDRIDDHFTFKTKDNKVVIVKSLIITLYKSQRSTKSQLKVLLKSLLEEEIKTNDFSTLMTNLVNRKVQSILKKRLHLIFPIKEVAVRQLILKTDNVTSGKVEELKLVEPIKKEAQKNKSSSVSKVDLSAETEEEASPEEVFPEEEA